MFMTSAAAKIKVSAWSPVSFCRLAPSLSLPWAVGHRKGVVAPRAVFFIIRFLPTHSVFATFSWPLSKYGVGSDSVYYHTTNSDAIAVELLWGWEWDDMMA